MPRGKKKTEVVGTVEAPEMEVSTSEPVKEAKTSFDVYSPDGGLVRTYTVEIHGENAEALANEFAAHTGGTVK
jgi:hypothetical protein